VVKVYALIPKRPDITVEEFHSHWRDIHAPLAKRITTMRRYVQSHAIRTGPGGLPQAIYEGVAEVWFDDLETAVGMGEDPNYVNGAGADEPSFIDQSRLTFLFCREHLPFDGPTLTAGAPELKVLLLLARPANPGAWPADALAEAALELPGLTRLLFAVSDTDLYQEGQPFDTLVELSWVDLAAYDTAWSGHEAGRFRQVLAGSADLQRSAGMVTEPFRVVWP
jgi:uncharacterized protein (TIGR02118 family)